MNKYKYNKNIKIETFDEDQGWIYFCERCGKRVRNEEVCPRCRVKFTETERV
jgi:rubrerythrin